MRLRFCAALIGVLMLAGSAVGQPAPPAPSAPPATASGHALTAPDVEAYFDGLIPYGLQRSDIAGAVVVVVKDGQVLFEKGYGLADVAARRPIDPETTLFRPGSISKLFTWTAVMQQVEAGRLDLDRDVNAYLDFKIPPAFGKPVTLRNLMTHTAGFEEANRALFARGPETMVSLESYVKSWTPKRIFPPGQVPAYSNYGAALAGYIVQRVSGEPFELYAQRHIFAPLGMQHATFLQPVPAGWAPLLSKGYQRASQPPAPFEIVNGTAAGSVSVTGADMGRFMSAYLNGGALGNARILRPETTRQMFAPAWTPIPRLPAMGLGFYHEDRGAHRILGHSGNTGEFHSDLHLFVDDGVGVFISMNSKGSDGGRGFTTLKQAVLQGFADRYFPGPPLPAEPTLASARADGARLVGAYISSRRSESNFVRMVSFLAQSQVTQARDGTLTVSTFVDTAGAPRHWREVAPFVWREVGGRTLMAARLKDGRVVGLSQSDSAPIFWLQPVPADMAGSWNMPLLLLAIITLLIATLSWPIAAMTRRHYGQAFALSGRPATAYRLARLGGLINLTMLLGWLLLIAQAAGGRPSFFDRPLDPWLLFLQGLGLLAVAGLAGPLWNLAVIWQPGSKRGWWAGTSSLLVAVACLATVWLGLMLRLIGFNLHY